MKTIEVVAAVIVRDGRIFATQRGYGDFKDMWEFPGGKIESGESREEALKREIKEELDAGITVDSFLQDIKADCILIESSKEVEIKGKKVTLYNIRLSEFNYARSFNKKKKLTKKVGTSYYVAPEVLNRNYNEKCDIWSIGVLLFVLLCGKPPFWGEDDKQITDKVRKGDPDWRKDEWTNVSQEGQDFVKLLLNTKSTLHPSSSTRFL